MIIETKYNIGDKVFYLKDNQVETETIFNIYVSAEFGGAQFKPNMFDIKYQINYVWYPEKSVFKTKQDLLNSL